MFKSPRDRSDEELDMLEETLTPKVQFVFGCSHDQQCHMQCPSAYDVFGARYRWSGFGVWSHPFVETFIGAVDWSVCARGTCCLSRATQVRCFASWGCPHRCAMAPSALTAVVRRNRVLHHLVRHGERERSRRGLHAVGRHSHGGSGGSTSVHHPESSRGLTAEPVGACRYADQAHL